MAALLESSPAQGLALPDKDPLEGLNKLQKLAALLVVLGHELALKILNEFDEREVEEITTEMAKITFVPVGLQHALLKEFSPLTIEAVTAAHGGPEYAREILEKALGTFKANEIMSRVAPTRPPKSVDTTPLRELQPRQIMNFLRRESAQTWALILSYLEPAACAEVLSQSTPEMRTDIVERIAMMEPVNAEVMGKVIAFIKSRLQLRGQMETARSGGTKILAQILNNLDDQASQQVLATLDERNPELSRAIKKLLFIFDDLADLDKASLQKVLRDVEMHDLAIALKTASDRVKTAIFSSMTKRAVESLQEEIQFMQPLRLKQIEEAQDKILDVVRTLEANGDIVVNRRGSGG
jgi:flagellar motor switch protein FliG